MSNWKIVRLGDVFEFNPKESIAKGAVAKKVAMDCLTPYCREISGFEFAEFSGGTKFRNGDTIMARITPCLENGKTAMVSILDDDEIGIGSTEYIVFREKEGISNKYFIYYFATNPAFRDIAIKSMVGSSGRQRVQQNVLENLEISLPPLAEQERIARILGSLDDKIECNNRINRNLEEQAAALFRRWFVDFEDKTWGTIDLGSVVETTSGGTPSRANNEYYEKGTVYWVKSKELNSSFIVNTEEKITEEAVKKSSAKKLPANSILIAMYGATVGEYGVISKEMTCNQAICALIPNEEYPYTFLLNFVKHNKEILINLAVGSAQQNISQQVIKSLPIIDYTDRINEFHKIIEPAYQQIKTNIEENRTLAELRDSLIPKLMNNEIKI